MRIGRNLIGIVAVLTAACAVSETPEQTQARLDQETAAFKLATEPLERNYERFIAEGKVDSLALLYTENGRALQPNGPVLDGRKAIADNETQNQAAMSWKVTITSERAVANGPIAIETGSYTAEGTPRPGTPRGSPGVLDRGKYMTHWHRVNGQWQIAELIWNSNEPLSMPGPPPARRPGT
jgi:ketosteroid isomerase-like protein